MRLTRREDSLVADRARSFINPRGFVATPLGLWLIATGETGGLVVALDGKARLPPRESAGECPRIKREWGQTVIRWREL